MSAARRPGAGWWRRALTSPLSRTRRIARPSSVTSVFAPSAPRRVSRSTAAPQDVFGGAKAQYNARGITDTRPDILRLDWVTHRIAIVEVRWPYLAADGDEVGEETSTYIIRREPDGQLAIRAAVLHGEAATH